MDEFKTTKLCSQCHQTLSQVSYEVDVMLPKKRKRKGVVLTRNRAEVQFEERTCYGVLRCDHKNCTAQYWDRYVNAAITWWNFSRAKHWVMDACQPLEGRR
ncbi:hypothetical protein DVH05_022613 [Phytophthora capsici]|nr:hypothetical protein DVH05_022613 [Phytophthora capsici]